MLSVGDRAPLEATVWLASAEAVTLADLLADGPILLLFYLFDWTGT
jgi:peroxiredoxin